VTEKDDEAAVVVKDSDPYIHINPLLMCICPIDKDSHNHVIITNSEAAACMYQNMGTADHNNNPSLYSYIF
jgi:hypothetical protein